MSQRRGELTKAVQNLALKHIGRKISVEELRLIPYIQYVMVNEQELDHRKMNATERQILDKWRDAEFIDGSLPLTISKKFWDFCCEVIFVAYVEIDK